ncbi:MAG: hypothetical protein SFX18_03655 [Pirellulales bacterium]|nr:hypothetical protein [Pirellulales bacterium]
MPSVDDSRAATTPFPVEGELWRDNRILDDHSISWPALATLVTGLLCLLVFVAPEALWVLVPLPLLAGLITWRQMAARPGHYLGANLAWLGLAVALFSAGVVGTRVSTTAALHRDQAARVADQFLKFIQAEEFSSAYELSLDRQRSFREAALRQLLIEDPKEQAAFDKFWNSPLLAQLHSAGKKLRWQERGVSLFGSDSFHDYWYVHYELTFPPEVAAQPRLITLVVSRLQKPNPKRQLWMLRHVQETPTQ